MSNRRFSTGEAVGLAAITTLSLIGGANAAPTPEKPQQEEQSVIDSREAIAHRFGSCAITAVHHHDSNPTRIQGDLRDQLDIDVILTETPPGLAAMQQYEEDDTVFWKQPGLVGTIVRNNSKATPYLEQVMTDGVDGRISVIADHNPRPFGSFLPRRYSEGTQAAFYAESTASTWPEDGIHQTEGYKYCGSLVVKDGTWALNTPENTFIQKEGMANPQADVTVETIFPKNHNDDPMTQVITHE
jgi:hypothetical protein